MREGQRQLQDKTIEVWDNLYLSYEKGKPLGILYPTEALVIFIATQKKPKSLGGYFDDKGKEYSVRNAFSGNALEIGFGSIANLKMVEEKGYKCYGLEVSSEAVRRGKKQLKNEGLETIKLAHWNPTKIPFPDNFFSLVYGLQCIYYNLKINKVIKEVERVLSPGGVFLFSFFSTSHTYMDYINSVSGVISRWSKNHPNPRLRGCYFIQPQSKNELAEWFSDFKDVRVFTTESDQTLLFESWWYVSGNKS